VEEAAVAAEAEETEEEEAEEEEVAVGQTLSVRARYSTLCH